MKVRSYGGESLKLSRASLTAAFVSSPQGDRAKLALEKKLAAQMERELLDVAPVYNVLSEAR